MREQERKDVVIIGGGPAGLSAALMLGRSRRSVLVCDAGRPRNAVSTESHSFLTRDGTPPQELRRLAREQLGAYPSVGVRDVAVSGVERLDAGFEVTLADGARVRARKLLLATGLKDEPPDIDGYSRFWGRGIYQCPYCHGWEARDTPLAFLGRGEPLLHMAPLLKNWSRDVIALTDGPSGLGEEEQRKLARYRIEVRETRVARLEGTDQGLEAIRFQDGSVLARHALFVRPPQRQPTDFPARLGCEVSEWGTVVTDEFRQTRVPGVYVAGDAANPRIQQLLHAAAEGGMTGAAMNMALVMEDLEAEASGGGY
jgi:thioredoxin reductase